MKGIELPINILVIVAVAIIVLLGVIALFYSSWFGGTAPLSLDSAKSQACSSAARAGCIAGLTEDIAVTYSSANGVSATLQDLCENEYNIDEDQDADCLTRVCGMFCGTGALA
jgi:hypothetical protein